MKIETFNELLKTQKFQAYAYIPEKGGKRENVVNVVFTPNGKVYTYKGTILDVATRLDLVPEIDIQAESGRAVADLLDTGSAVAHIECADTINYLLPGKTIEETGRAVDEFDRPIATFAIVTGGSEWI